MKKGIEGIPAKKIPAKPQIRLRPVKAETIRLKTDESYGLAIIAFRMPGYDSPDYPACRVLADALSNQRSSLFELVPQGKALYAEFSLDAMPQVGLGYAMTAFPGAAKGEALVSEMERILAEDRANGLPADLVEAAKRTRQTKTELKKNSVEGLAMEWSDAVVLEGKESPEDMVTEIAKVSVDEVNRAAKKYLDPRQSIVTILTPEPSGKPGAGATHGPGVESFTPANAKAAQLPEWAKEVLRQLRYPNRP